MSAQLPPISKPELEAESIAKKADPGLAKVAQRLANTLKRDALVQKTTDQLQQSLQVNRVALYYFYGQWQGQVTFEALSDEAFSILGSTGADDCFNAEYAELYLEGRVCAIPDIEQAPIHDCHRDFLRSLNVRANLVIPILTPRGLWGLLAIHHCQEPRTWSAAEIATAEAGAATLATAPAIRGS